LLTILVNLAVRAVSTTNANVHRPGERIRDVGVRETILSSQICGENKGALSVRREGGQESNNDQNRQRRKNRGARNSGTERHADIFEKLNLRQYIHTNASTFVEKN
jgi:hypothetical protein